MNRRHFTQTTGSIALGLLAGCLSTGSSESHTNGSGDDGDDEGTNTPGDNEDATGSDTEPEGIPENGMVVFVYDDGPIEDYTQALPAHKEFDAPATTGIVSNWIGRSDEWMDVHHLEELAEEGWEIASHTEDHTTVAGAEIVHDVEADGRRIYAEHYRHGHHDVPIEIVGVDLDVAITRGIVDRDRDDDGDYLVLDEDVGVDLSAGEAMIRYPEEQMRDALGGSKEHLESLGFDVRSFLAPYDQFDEWALSHAAEHYEAICNAQHGSRINDPHNWDPLKTRRDYFIEFTTPEAVQTDLDVIARERQLGVIGAHTFKDEVSEDAIRETLEWIDARGIEVVTLAEAIDRIH